MLTFSNHEEDIGEGGDIKGPCVVRSCAESEYALVVCVNGDGDSVGCISGRDVRDGAEIVLSETLNKQVNDMGTQHQQTTMFQKRWRSSFLMD